MQTLPGLSRKHCRASVHLCRREVVDSGVAHIAPVGVVFHAAQGYVGCCAKVRHIEPHGDVLQRGPLHFVQGAGVAQPHGVMDDLVLRSPGVHCQHPSLIGPHDDIALVHAQHCGTHAVHKADLFVQILGENDVGVSVDSHIQRHFGNHISLVEVVDVAFRVCGQYGQRIHFIRREKHFQGQLVKVGRAFACASQEHGLGRLLQNVVDVVQAGRLLHHIAGSAPRWCFVTCCDFLELLLARLVGPERLQGFEQLGALAPAHCVELPLLDVDAVPPRRGQSIGLPFLGAGKLVEVSHEDQSGKLFCGLPLFHYALKNSFGELAHFFNHDQIVGLLDLQSLLHRPVNQKSPVHGVNLKVGKLFPKGGSQTAGGRSQEHTSLLPHRFTDHFVHCGAFPAASRAQNGEGRAKCSCRGKGRSTFSFPCMFLFLALLEAWKQNVKLHTDYENWGTYAFIALSKEILRT